MNELVRCTDLCRNFESVRALDRVDLSLSSGRIGIIVEISFARSEMNGKKITVLRTLKIMCELAI